MHQLAQSSRDAFEFSINETAKELSITGYGAAVASCKLVSHVSSSFCFANGNTSGSPHTLDHLQNDVPKMAKK
jgi:hypothetical protein